MHERERERERETQSNLMMAELSADIIYLGFTLAARCVRLKE